MATSLTSTGVTFPDGSVRTTAPTVSAYMATYSSRYAIFGFGWASSGVVSLTNKVSDVGVVASDTAGVGSIRYGLGAASYGGDKGIFALGGKTPANTIAELYLSISSLVSNTGVVANDSATVATARKSVAASSYGTDKAIFAFGTIDDGGGGTAVSTTNLVSNTGVMASDVATTATPHYLQPPAGARYGGDKAIFAYGSPAYVNLVSNTGVMAGDTSAIGSIRSGVAAASYGGDKAIFGYGSSAYPNSTSVTNLVSNTGVLATDTTGVGTARQGLAASIYGGDKAIFAYGFVYSPTFAYLSMTNLVSNTGVVATDTTGVGTARSGLAATGFGL